MQDNTFDLEEISFFVISFYVRGTKILATKNLIPLYKETKR